MIERCSRNQRSMVGIAERGMVQLNITSKHKTLPVEEYIILGWDRLDQEVADLLLASVSSWILSMTAITKRDLMDIQTEINHLRRRVFKEYLVTEQEELFGNPRMNQS